ncbi:MAG TPA: hypothetical protein VJ063_06645, partial [Verrucomicrobiae bacterium]|nr:hypothetical protein [Verrucomicrobiae bacterium]
MGRKLLAAALLCGVGAFLALTLDFHEARHWIQGVNSGWFLLLFALLPILGFPLSILQIVAGVKFGFWTGMSVTAVAMSVHLLGAHWLASGR